MPNETVQTSSVGSMPSNSQKWPWVVGAPVDWFPQPGQQQTPTIAIVDSGIQSRPDFGTRVLASVNLSTLPNSPGDGTGTAPSWPGSPRAPAPASGRRPAANLVDVKVLGDEGMGLTSDIIRACQWILDNKTQYNIQVANFSLHSSINAPFYIDPLDPGGRAALVQRDHGRRGRGNYGTAAGPTRRPLQPR